MSLSRRHHYVPQFHIRNFAASDNFLYVYNKEQGKISRQSPKSMFFEMDRNTVLVGQQRTDNLEQLYADLDDELAVGIKKLLTTKRLEPEEVASVSLLATQLKWRTPVRDAEFAVLKTGTPLADLALEVKIDPKAKVPQEEIDRVANSDLFREAKRTLLPVVPLLADAKMEDIYNHCFLYSHTDERFPSLLGDCPLIEEPNNDYTQLRNFVLPLSSTAVFIYKSGARRGLRQGLPFSMTKDLATLHLAKKYVACSSRSHLEAIVLMYEQMKATNYAERLTQNIFGYIE